jgi:CRISPR system Cascade subunit CasA
MNLLDDALISIRRGDGSTRKLSLPELFAELVRDQVVDYPAMRAHQRPAWHTLLVQLGALAAYGMAESSLPDDAASWRHWLLALTPEWPGGDAWALCSDVHDRPAFLQPAVTGGKLDGFKATSYADDIDVLISSKNHDVKQSSIGRPAPEHWLYALITLQTQQGFFGAGNYGISRMNGGFSSRPLFGVRPRGGHGQWITRDVRELLLRRAQTLADFPFYQTVGGHALTWLCPWDGTKSLSMGELDPWYIEICRRVRLTADTEKTICAWLTGTRVARIDAKGMSGLTGDPWTPIVADGAEWKALTAHSETMHYRNLVPLLFPRIEDAGGARRAPLQVVTERDEADGLRISVAVVVRGQGKTEGLYEREIPVSRMTRSFLLFGASDVGAHVARERVADVALISRQVLYPAALAVFTGAPLAGERKRDDDTAKARALRAVGEFERAVDLDFFEQLNLELEHIEDESRSLLIRSTWLTELVARARKVLDATMQRAPSSAARRYRMQARASLLFSSSLRRHLGDRVIAAPAVAPADPEPDSVEANNVW